MKTITLDDVKGLDDQVITDIEGELVSVEIQIIEEKLKHLKLKCTIENNMIDGLTFVSRDCANKDYNHYYSIDEWGQAIASR